MRTKERLSSYHALSSQGQDNAYHRNYHIMVDYGWWEAEIEAFVERMNELGIYTQPKDVHFTGFCNQGDGASFTGRVCIHRFFDAHPEFISRYPLVYSVTCVRTPSFDVWANITRMSSLHAHQFTVNIEGDIDTTEIEGAPEYWLVKAEYDAFMKDCLETCRGYMTELYHDLDTEYDALTSKKNFAEVAKINDWLFDEDGNMP